MAWGGGRSTRRFALAAGSAGVLYADAGGAASRAEEGNHPTAFEATLASHWQSYLFSNLVGVSQEDVCCESQSNADEAPKLPVGQTLPPGQKFPEALRRYMEWGAVRGCTAASSPLVSGTLPTRSISIVSLAWCAILTGTLALCSGCATWLGPHCRHVSCGDAIDLQPCEEIAPETPGNCAEGVSSCDDGATHVCAVNGPKPYVRCFVYSQELCYRCCDFVVQPVWGLAEPIACWPVNKVRHIVNFCAPDGCVGPPDMVGPGRFHAVPTHPVFAPVVVSTPDAQASNP